MSRKPENPISMPFIFTSEVNVSGYDWNDDNMGNINYIPSEPGEIYVPITHSPLIYNVMPGRYYISNFGKVYDRCNNRFVAVSSNGRYLKVNLCYFYDYFHTSYKPVYIHRLVAYYFLASPDWDENVIKSLEVNHKDGNKLNNIVSNLEWCTPEYNREHAMAHGLIKSGEDHPYTFITNDQAEEICKLIIAGKSNMEIEQMLNIPAYLISRIRAGESFTNISKKYHVRDTIRNQRKDLTEDDVIKICTMIMKGNNFKEIMEATGASYSQIHDLKYSNTYNDIKSMFRLDKAPSLKEKQRGLSDEEVHNICKLIQDGKGIAEISRITETSKSTINAIKNGGYYSEITSQYTFPANKPKPNHTKEEIEEICKLLEENKLSDKEIAEKMGKTIGVIKAIKRGLAYKDISSKYTFHSKEVSQPLTEDQVRNVCQLIVSGKNNRYISDILNISYNIISRIRCRNSYTDISKDYKW